MTPGMGSFRVLYRVVTFLKGRLRPPVILVVSVPNGETHSICILVCCACGMATNWLTVERNVVNAPLELAGVTIKIP